MAPPVVALLTDFGTRDHYVGAVKGAILEVCRDATLVDVTHEIAPHDVEEGALALERAYGAFPAATVFVAVVDPGVGGPRRGMALEAGGFRFVGPDNGLFSFVLAAHPDAAAREITNAAFFRREVSNTFHARDVFGPVAGRLAGGASLDSLGPPLSEPVLLPIARVLPRGDGEWEAVVLHVDRFGNLTTNVGRAELEQIVSSVGGDPTRLVAVVEGSVLPLVRAYGDVAEGEPCALLGSSARLELAANRANASRLLGAGRGTRLRLRKV